MPELPEVETIKESLKRAIDGAFIESIVVRNRRFRESIPDEFEKVISNSNIKKIYRIAKYVVIDLDNEYSIIWHFGMSGRIKFTNNIDDLDKHDHVIIKLNNGYVIYNDARRFGLITYTKTKEINNHHLFSKIGLDPFDTNLNATYLLNKLKNKNIEIKIALLDQSIINGIGNIYASEALYDARISPFKKSCSISLDEANKLIESIQKILKKAIKAGGSTLKDYKKPDGSTGYFQNEHCVYNKTGQRCPNCCCDISKTSGIKKATQGGRSTFFCETLQKEES